MNLLQFVGYQNSGKTTIVSELIKRVTAEGIKVGTIKHHGHGGSPDVGKDTYLHREAGALSTAVEGDGMLLLSSQRAGGWSLDQLLKLYEQFDHDFILIEGYKRAAYPKVVFLRHHDDEKLLAELENIVAVISAFESDQYFWLENKEPFFRWGISYIKEQINVFNHKTSDLN